MTEQDERTIYEWAVPELAELTQWDLRKSKGLPPTAMWNQRHNAKILHHLDMNFAFDVCMTRLKNESVSLVTIMYTPSTEGCGGNPYVCSIDCAADGAYDDVGATANEAFYSALLAYIKGVK